MIEPDINYSLKPANRFTFLAMNNQAGRKTSGPDYQLKLAWGANYIRPLIKAVKSSRQKGFDHPADSSPPRGGYVLLTAILVY